MGGLGSHGHRTFPNAKAVTDQYHKLDIRQWSRLGLLENTEPFNFDWEVNDKIVATSRVKLEDDCIYISPIYYIGDSQFHSDHQRITLWRHPINFGGYRNYLVCPGYNQNPCGKRVCLLYGADRFLCRDCLKLVYRCSRQSVNDLDQRRLEKSSAKLGWEPHEYLDGKRPHYMHEETYDRLKLACVENAETMRTNTLKEYRRMFPSLGDKKLNR